MTAKTFLDRLGKTLRSRTPYLSLVAPRGWGKTALSRMFIWELGLSAGEVRRFLLPQADHPREGLNVYLDQSGKHPQEGLLILDEVVPQSGQESTLGRLAEFLDRWTGSRGGPALLVLALPEAVREAEAILSRTRLEDLEGYFRDNPRLLGELVFLHESLTPSDATLPEKLGRLLLRSPKSLGPFRMGVRLLREVVARSSHRENSQVSWELLQEVYTEWEGEETGLFWKKGWTEEELFQALNERVKGQEEALRTLARSLAMAYSKFHHPGRPRGAFLLLGPTGVGKTETAKAIAQVGFGSERYLIRFDMAEFQQGHSIYRFIGAPPGYVGYGEGELTSRLRKQPQSVLLLDEIEKADFAVRQFLLALLDEGRVTDGRGETLDARETVILMTTNVPEGSLPQHFSPEFLNRVVPIRYKPLREREKVAILKSKLREILKRLEVEGIHVVGEEHKWEELLHHLVQTHPNEGVRGLDRRLRETLYEAALCDPFTLDQRGYYQLQLDERGHPCLVRQG